MKHGPTLGTSQVVEAPTARSQRERLVPDAFLDVSPVGLRLKSGEMEARQGEDCVQQKVMGQRQARYLNLGELLFSRNGNNRGERRGTVVMHEFELTEMDLLNACSTARPLGIIGRCRGMGTGTV